jgi:hypothetical protein
MAWAFYLTLTLGFSLAFTRCLLLVDFGLARKGKAWLRIVWTKVPAARAVIFEAPRDFPTPFRLDRASAGRSRLRGRAQANRSGLGGY